MASAVVNPTPTPPARPRRRWYQFTLRTAGIWMVLLCLLLGSFAWWRDRAERQRKVVEELRALGARVDYRLYSLTKRETLDDSVMAEEEFFLCAWVSNCLGMDYVYDVSRIGVGEKSPGVTRSSLRLISNFTHLKELLLDRDAVTAEDLEALPCLAELELLMLHSSGRFAPHKSPPGRLTDSGMEVFERATHLQYLHLNDQPIGDDGVRHLRHCRNLQDLSLEETLIGDKGLEHLAELTKIRDLNLSRTRVTDKGLKYLRNLNQLAQLSLSQNDITGEGFANVGPKPRLHYLNLAETGFLDSGLRHLKQFPKLESLLLMETRVTGIGIPDLSTLSDLNFVSLKACPVSDLSIYAGITIPDGWEYLVLDGARFTDKGFCRIKFPQSIEHIGLEDTDVTDVSLDHLQGLPKLECIEADNTNITPDGIKRLQARLPNCKVNGWPRQMLPRKS
jgi:hypothetical protein